MIGRLHRGDKTLAVLNDKGEWECDDPLRLEYLRLLRQPTGSPSQGAFGAAEIAAAAEDIDCEYVYKPPAGGSPNAIH